MRDSFPSLRKTSKFLILALGGVLLLVLAFSIGSPRAWATQDHAASDVWRGVTESLRRPKSKHVGPPKGSEPNYVAGSPKANNQSYTRGLVMARTKSDDVDWVKAVAAKPYLYSVDDPTAALRTPINKGHEAMAYLTYIIDNYNLLPDISIFMHSHRHSHHNNQVFDGDAIEMIRHLSNNRVMRQGYVNLRCLHSPGCPHVLADEGAFGTAIPMQDGLRDMWDYIFPGKPPPYALEQPCCAQFAVSKERIWATTRARYIYYRDWLLQTELDDYLSGRVFEYTWQLIFKGLTSDCEDEFICFCDVYGICFVDAEELNLWMALFHEEERIQYRLDEEPVDKKERAALTKRMRDYSHERQELKNTALSRGQRPEIRAEVSHRDWYMGDGF